MILRVYFQSTHFGSEIYVKLQEAVGVTVGCVDTILVNSVKMLGLFHLNLSKSTNVSDAGVQSLSGLVSLQHLDLSGCRNITDAGVQSLSGLVSLHHLNLRWSAEDTGAGTSLMQEFRRCLSM